MLHFDKKGYLTPYNVIPATLKEFRSFLVDGIKSETRQDNYDKFIKYSGDLKKLLGGDNVKYWINGSFVTKKSNPNDIDLVIFLESAQIKKLGKHLDNFKMGGSIPMYGIDAYLVEVYPHNNKFYSHTKGNTAYWLELFGCTKINRTGKKYRKGFLEIIC